MKLKYHPYWIRTRNPNSLSELSERMKNTKKALLLSTLLLSKASFAVSDLLDIYQQALASDPVFKQAYSQYMSSKEALPQAMAQLLPTLAVTGFWNKIDYKSSNPNPLLGVESNYREWNYTFTASQPIFNYAAFMAAKQAGMSVMQAQATFSAQAQDLMIRTATAYFTVLQAKDRLRFAKAKERANLRQLDQARQRFKVGLDAITSVYEAKAAYDSSRALVITERNNLLNEKENLRKITNHTYDHLAPLKTSHVPLVKPEPAFVDDWVDTALRQNYQLLASKYAEKAARFNIKVQNAGHLPTLTLQATSSETNSNSSKRFLASDVLRHTVGINMQFPIFQSGLVLSQTKQATYDYQATYEQYEITYRDTIVNTRIAYNTIIDGISKIRADRQAVASAQNSVDSTEAQFKVGTRTMVDVVNAQQNLFQAQTQLATDQYSYILAILQLKFLAGTLNANDLQETNAWLRTNRRYRALKPFRHYNTYRRKKPRLVKRKKSLLKRLFGALNKDMPKAMDAKTIANVEKEAKDKKQMAMVSDQDTVESFTNDNKTNNKTLAKPSPKVVKKT